MKNLILLFSLTLVGQVFAAQTAKVLMVKGNVTALRPGDKNAIVVKRGQVLPEETSILTASKSIVRIKFADKSTMNLGPKSKVVVSKLPKKKPNMINLLTGAIKAEVNKKSNKPTSNKMLIKTRSAVMGVRGTKFQAGFNPTNGNTSLVTVEGKVAMVKRKAIEEKVVTKVVEEKVIDESGKEVIKKVEKEVIEKIADLAADSDAELDALDKALETSKEAVEVPAGRFSGVSEASKETTATAPTKIAPSQYDALAKSMDSDKKATDVFTDKELEQAAKSSADKAGAVGQKAGGFVDFKTGIYVPPPKGSKKDNKTGVYVAKDIGKADETTGEYIPPKGVKLDAKKGFIVDQEKLATLASADKKALKNTMKKLESVNQEVKDQVVVNTMTAKEKEDAKPWYKADYHHLTASMQPYSESIQAKNKGSGSEADFYTKEANIVELGWKQEWNDRWSTILGLGFTQYKLDDTDIAVRESGDKDDEKILIGLHYNWSESLALSLELTNQNFFFAFPNGGGDGKEISVESQSLRYFNLGAKYFLWDWKSLGLYAGANLYLFGEDEFSDDEECDPSGDGGCEGPMKVNSFGWKGYMTGKYEFRDDMGINATGYVERITHESDDMDWTRLAIGTQVQFFYSI